MRETTAPEEAEAQMNQKINERFKSLSIRNIKNHSNTGGSSRPNAGASSTYNSVNKRRNLGIRSIKDIGVSPNAAVSNNLSPLTGGAAIAFNFDKAITPNRNTLNQTTNLLSTVERSPRTGGLSGDAEDYMFTTTTLERIKVRNL